MMQTMPQSPRVSTEASTIVTPVFVPAVLVAPDYATLCQKVAKRIVTLVCSKPNAVLGLATGSTPRGVYDLLAQHYKSGEVDFSRVTCFNLDEYYPMLPGSRHSYHDFMHRSLFSCINCRRWFVPDGRHATTERVVQACQDYEARIADAGGIDLQLLGIGRTGHIGFNEPGSPRASRTRRVILHPLTREDAAASFGGLEYVPLEAVSMGIATILEAQEIMLMASGPAKASSVHLAWAEDITEHVPASWLRTHPNTFFCLDERAAALLPEIAREEEKPPRQ